MMRCAICDNKECTAGKDCTDISDRTRDKISERDNLALWKTASLLESEYYMKLTRLEETVKFARDMGFERLGIAFCIGLSQEAEILHHILSRNFSVLSACCKVCGIGKGEFDTPPIVEGRFEAICNPIGQAEILNRGGSEMNIILGLCVGHDMLFSKYSRAPVTTLVTKDRILGHNSVVALTNRYYRKKWK